MFPQPSQDQQQKPGGGLKDAAGWLYLLSMSHATCLTPFIRRGYGSEHFRLNAVVALAMILAWAAAADSAGVLAFFWCWLAAVACHRAASLRRWRRADAPHSRYTGWPWLAMRVPLVRREVTAKAVVEPLLCLVGGALLCPVSEALGAFVMLGCLSLLFQAGIEREIDRMRVLRMRDAVIEQRQLAARFRGKVDDL